MAAKISMKGLARFMTEDAVKQRKTLFTYKYPDDRESKAQRAYYRDATQAIERFHAVVRNSSWLLNRAVPLETEAMALSDEQWRRKTRLNHNARAMREYANSFGNRRFKLLDRVSFSLAHQSVNVNVFPDLRVEERGLEKWIKFDFTAGETDDKLRKRKWKIMCQLMLAVCDQEGLGLPSGRFLVLEPSSGREHREARYGARIGAEILATCANIASIWHSI